MARTAAHLKTRGLVEFSDGTANLGPGIVTAVGQVAAKVQVQSLAQDACCRCSQSKNLKTYIWYII